MPTIIVIYLITKFIFLIKYLLLCLITVNTVTAQESNQSINLTNAEIIPHQIVLTQNKTAHILFPHRIQYVDLESNEIIANILFKLVHNAI